MKTKNYASTFLLFIEDLPEKELVKKISLLSREISQCENLSKILFKNAQRNYYLNELVRRDETTQL